MGAEASSPTPANFQPAAAIAPSNLSSSMVNSATRQNETPTRSDNGGFGTRLAPSNVHNNGRGFGGSNGTRSASPFGQGSAGTAGSKSPTKRMGLSWLGLSRG